MSRSPLPADPALPALARALDGDAMAEALEAALTAGGEGGRIGACRPAWLRYKPGAACHVRYDVVVRRPGAPDAAATVAASLYAGDRAAAVWDAPPFPRLRERAARLHPGPFVACAALLRDLGAIVQVAPLDRKLRGLLRAASPSRARRDAHRALGGHAPGTPDVRLVRHNLERRAVLRYAFPDDAPAVYAKLGRRHPAAWRSAVANGLAASGLPVARALGVADATGAVLFEAIDGEPLKARRGRPDVARWTAGLVDILARLHGLASGVPGAPLPRRTPADEAASLVAAAGLLDRLRPDWSGRATRLAHALGAAMAAAPGRPAPIHGDFYDDQLIARPHGALALIDLDDAALGDGAIDLGTFLAHQRAWALFAPRPERTAAEAFAGEVRDEAAARLPDDFARADLHEAAGLLRLAVHPLRRLEDGWAQRMDAILAAAETLLADHERAPFAPGRRAAPCAIDDPAIPGLRRLQAPEAATLLATTMGVPGLDGGGGRVLRHKPGRRALLRFDARIEAGESSRTVTVYAKAFASDRAGRVHAAHHALHAAMADVPDVHLPRPLGWLDDARLVLLDEVPGHPVAPRLEAGDVDLAARLARAIDALHRSGAVLERDHGPADEWDLLARRVAALQGSLPRLARRAGRALDRLAAVWPAASDWRRRPIHRDLHPAQILWDGRAVGLVDLDDAAMGEPALDVANLTGHLVWAAVERPGAARAAAAAEALRRAHRTLDPALDPRVALALEAGTLLRLVTIHGPRAGTDVAAAGLRACEERLAALEAGTGSPVRRERSTSPRRV